MKKLMMGEKLKLRNYTKSERINITIVDKGHTVVRKILPRKQKLKMTNERPVGRPRTKFSDQGREHTQNNSKRVNTCK
jgi:hypothetical protein